MPVTTAPVTSKAQMTYDWKEKAAVSSRVLVILVCPYKGRMCEYSRSEGVSITMPTFTHDTLTLCPPPPHTHMGGAQSNPRAGASVFHTAFVFSAGLERRIVLSGVHSAVLG